MLLGALRLRRLRLLRRVCQCASLGVAPSPPAPSCLRLLRSCCVLRVIGPLWARGPPPRLRSRSPPLALWVPPRLQPLPPGVYAVASVWAAAASQPEPFFICGPPRSSGGCSAGAVSGQPGSGLHRPLSALRPPRGLGRLACFASVGEFVRLRAGRVTARSSVVARWGTAPAGSLDEASVCSLAGFWRSCHRPPRGCFLRRPLGQARRSSRGQAAAPIAAAPDSTPFWGPPGAADRVCCLSRAALRRPPDRLPGLALARLLSGLLCVEIGVYLRLGAVPGYVLAPKQHFQRITQRFGAANRVKIAVFVEFLQHRVADRYRNNQVFDYCAGFVSDDLTPPLIN